MTLTNRLTLFFLAALAVVLAAFSSVIYALVLTDQYRQLNDRAEATLNTLVAGAETEEEGLEWEPKDRQLLLRGEKWAIFDENGQRVDGSKEKGPALDEFAAPGSDLEKSPTSKNWEGETWRVVRRTLNHPNPAAVKTGTQPDRVRYRTLVLVTALPLSPIDNMLRHVTLILAGASLGVWIAAALVSRWICRRALAPVRRMAESAKQIKADDLGQRLPIPVPADELRDLATTFNELLLRVQVSYERQRRFTGEASHQLRTPLAAMIGQIEVALRRERDSEEYQRVLSAILSQGERMRSILEMLLFLARADADAKIPDLESIDLRKWLLTHLDDTWAKHRRFADLRIDASTVEGIVTLAHAPLLGQAIDNLVDNAFKYSTSGSFVHVRLAREGDSALIVVEDRGQGIAAEELNQIFDPFFRSSAARQKGINGVGLGLAVTSRIIAAFGGKVSVDSQFSEGSRFIIRLPLANGG